MRFSMSIGHGDVASALPQTPAPGAAASDPAAELRLLETQLVRMRGMLFGFEGGVVGLVIPAALAWTAAIVVYLLWSSLWRADEERLLAALRIAYGETTS